ncbi:MAG TPA: hypothetical protein VFL73_00585 [Solirubrobacteraceae bacterium]|nr:hypothetical protein [Solirubrobacteraceae bacterium]
MSTELDRLRAAYAPIDAPLPARTRARIDELLARPPRRARRARIVPLAAAGALAVAAIIVVALLPASGTRGPVVASARAACAHPAAAAADCGHALGAVSAGATIPGSGDILYRRGIWTPLAFTVSARASHDPNHIQLASAHTPFTVVRTASEELWLAPDGQGREAHTDGGPARPQTAADRAAWRAAGSPDLERLVPNPQGMRPLSQNVDARATYLGANGLYDFLPHAGDPLAPIPRDHDALAAWLRDRAFKERAGNDPGCHPDGSGCNAGALRLLKDTYVGDIETLLAYPATPPDLRAALVTLLGEIPGARTLGLVRDPIGRQVAAISVNTRPASPGEPSVIAFDPDTGELRATGSPGPHGTIRWSTTYATTTRRVQAIGDRPRGEPATPRRSQ